MSRSAKRKRRAIVKKRVILKAVSVIKFGGIAIITFKISSYFDVNYLFNFLSHPSIGCQLLRIR